MLQNGQTIAQNKRAKFDYHIDEEFEAGIVLTGTEVKSLRLGKAQLHQSYAAASSAGEIELHGFHIAEYMQAGKHLQHRPTRPRKLLLHKRQIDKLIGAVQTKGVTLIPMRVYFNARGRIKLRLGLGRGKQAHDKRDTIKDRDWKRDQARILKDNN